MGSNVSQLVSNRDRRHSAWVTHPARVTRMVQECTDVFTYDLHFDDPVTAEAFDFQPGQFNMLYVPGIGESAISIAGWAKDGRGLRHTIRSVGNVTDAIARCRVGMSLGIRGPFGSHWPIERLTQAKSPLDVVVVAGGIGLAPLRSLIEFMIEHRSQIGNVDLLLGARSPQDFLYREDWDRWKEHGIRIALTVDRADRSWQGHLGVITLLLEQMTIPDPANTLLMTCGPEVMMRYVGGVGAEKQIALEDIWLTLERNMNCAIGLCGHCQLGPEFICKDGPVLRYGRVRQWLRVQDL